MRKSRPIVIKLPKGRSKVLKKIMINVRILNFNIVYTSQADLERTGNVMSGNCKEALIHPPPRHYCYKMRPVWLKK